MSRSRAMHRRLAAVALIAAVHAASPTTGTAQAGTVPSTVDVRRPATPVGPAATDSAALALLDRAARAYQGTRSLRAEFTQQLSNPRTRTDLRSRGEFFQKGATLFAFHFSEPPEDRIVSDGQVLWLYSPSTAKGQVFKMPRAAGAGMDLATGILKDPSVRYTVTAVGDSTIDSRAVRGVRLVPRTPGGPFIRGTLWLDTESALVRRAEFSEPSGLVRTLTFSNVRIGNALPKGVFTFTPPPGVRVIDQAALLGGSPRP